MQAGRCCPIDPLSTPSSDPQVSWFQIADGDSVKPIVVPTKSVLDWKRRLAQPKKQWRDKYSAKALARAWESAKGLPPEIRALLRSLGDIELLFAIPEYDVALPGGARPSQSDVFALARTHDGLVVVMVEGKVAESFDATLERWQKNASPGRMRRLAFLKNTLGLTADLPPGVRYQLLHRAASAVIEASRFHAGDAVLVIHSFSPKRASYDDYQTLLGLFGKRASPGQMVALGTASGIRLWAGWAQGDPRFLKA